MRFKVAVTLACCALATSCGRAGLEQRGRYAFASLTVRGDASAVRAALDERSRALGPIAAVFLNGVALPDDRAGADHVVTIAAKPTDEAGFGVADTIVVDETGGGAAVDLVLLAKHGLELPRRIALGTRVVTRANLAANGVARAAAGDFVLDLLRREHAALLGAAAPDTPKVRIGLVQLRPDDPRQARAAAEVTAAARSRPVVELERVSAAGDVNQQNAAIASLIREGRAAIVITDDPASLAVVRKSAIVANAAIVVIDVDAREDIGTSVGPDQIVLGRAAAEAIVRAVPTGGTVLELHADLGDPIVRKRHQGFVAALGGF